MTAPRQVPPLPSRAYVSVTLDVDESGREMLRSVSLDGRRWQVTREGPPRTVGRATEAQPPTVREVSLAGLQTPHEVWRQGTRWFVMRKG